MGDDLRRPIGTSSHFFYGWVIVSLSAFAVFCSGPGQTYSVSEFVNTYTSTLHMSHTLVSELYSVATLFAGLSLFFIGRLVDRYGARRLLIFAGCSLGLACLWNGFVVGPISLLIGFAGIRLFGQGSLTLIPSTLVPQWFIRKRGRAFSLMSVGGIVSASVFPILNTWFLESWGWHVSWVIWAGLLLLVFVPMSALFVRNRPEDIGLLPDGINSNGGIGSHMLPVAGPDDELSWTLSEAMHSRAFWFILFCLFVPSMVNTGLTFNLFSILGTDGFSPSEVAGVLSVIPLIGFLSTLGSGFLMERMAVHWIIAVTFVLDCIQIALLIWAHSTIAVVWPNYYGRAHLGAINGVSSMASVLGAAFGPTPFGLAYQIFGSYEQVLLLMLGFACVGLILSLFARSPVKQGIS